MDPSAARPSGRLLEDERGVTPVVGTILVLAISTVGIFAVMYWGVPAVTEVQDQTAFEAVLTQYETADGIVENVIRGGTPNKAGTMTMSIPGGALEWNEGSRFVVELYFKAGGGTASFDFQGWQDRDSVITIANDGADLADATLEVIVWRGLRSYNITTDVGAWGAGQEIEFDLAPLVLDKEVLSFRIHDGLTLLYEMWLLDAGQFRYRVGTSLSYLELAEENAATLSNQSKAYWMHTRPLVQGAHYPAPNDAYYERLTMYLVQLVRNETFGYPTGAGRGNYPLLFSLRDNWLRDANVDLVRLDIRVHGPWRQAWVTYFTEQLALPPLPAGDGVKYEGTVANPVRFAMFHSQVEMTLLPKNTPVDSGNAFDFDPLPPPPPPPPPWNPGGGPQCQPKPGGGGWTCFVN